MLARRVEAIEGDLLRVRPVATVAASQRERAVSQRLDPELVVVGEPAVDCVAGVRIVRVPADRVLQRRLDVVTQQERIAPDAIHPAQHRVVRFFAGPDRPAQHEVRNAAVRQVVGRLVHKALADRVAAEPAVAVGEGRVGRDGERRVADDQVEVLAGHGLVEAALAQLDVAAAIEQPVEVGELERARVHVGGDDALGLPERSNRLDAAAGAEVERGRDRAAHGEVREQQPRRSRPDDVRTAAASGTVAGEDEIARRDELHLRDDRVAANLDEAARLRGRDGQCRGRLGDGHLELEQKEPDQRRPWIVSQHAQRNRDVLATGHEPVLAERLGNPVRGVPRVAKRRAQQFDGRWIELDLCHARHSAAMAY